MVLDAGGAERAGAMYRLVSPYADRVAVSYPEISTGSVARTLGLLAATSGDRDAAARHFRAAVEVNERIGARSWAAHARMDHARLLLETGADADDEPVRSLVDAAQAAYRDLGMEAHARGLAM